MKDFGKIYGSMFKALVVLGLISLLFISSERVTAAKLEKKPYLIKVNRVHNTVTVYEQNDKGEYSVPVRAMLCSVGVGGRTIKGTFQTMARYRWKALMGDVWGQYATRVVGGILFHSVYYYENGNPATLATKEFNKLGSAASHGCIRLSVVDAKWIYDNCAVGTTVIIYDGKKSPGPLGKPEAIKLPTSVRWDPTDPNKDNPYNIKQPKITGAKSIKVSWGQEMDLRKGVKAKSSLGYDITELITVEDTVDYFTSGKYKVTYSVTDILGRTIEKKISITVGEGIINPYFKGIRDRIVNPEVQIDEAFALSGVSAYSEERKLDQKLIEVIVEQVNEDEYSITYQIMVDGKVAVEERSKVLVDREAPILTGMVDHNLEAGEIPDLDYLMYEVKVSDNITKIEDIQVQVTMKLMEDGNYLVTYLAIDEAGNEASAQTEILY